MEEWTGRIVRPSHEPPGPVGALKMFAETMMQTLASMQSAQVRIELHGKVLVLTELGRNEVYAIGMVDHIERNGT